MLHAPLGWLQLKQEKMRFAVALAGVAFAVVLILMQLGFQSALYKSSVRVHEMLDYEVVILSRESAYIAQPDPFSRRRLYQILSVPGVASVEPFYAQLGLWKNPFDGTTRRIFVMGFDPAARVVVLPEVLEQQERVKRRDAALFDRASRPEYGPVAAHFEDAGPIVAEVNDREVEILGLFELGTSFGIDGSLLTSESTFMRLFSDRDPGLIDLGLVRLAEGADVKRVQAELRSALPADVLVLTRPEYIEREMSYWASATAIGYIFGFGLVVGLLVGAIVVYQILFADVSDHLADYATLKAIGYGGGSLGAIVLQQAAILGLFGFVPGLCVGLWLYSAVGEATRLPMAMTPGRALGVLGLTLGMCAIAGLAALRKVRAADPAELF
jgi:putative ABC transport system permease protein